MLLVGKDVGEDGRVEERGDGGLTDKGDRRIEQHNAQQCQRDIELQGGRNSKMGQE